MKTIELKEIRLISGAQWDVNSYPATGIYIVHTEGSSSQLWSCDKTTSAVSCLGEYYSFKGSVIEAKETEQSGIITEVFALKMLQVAMRSTKLKEIKETE